MNTNRPSDNARNDRESLLLQTREANERLVAAKLREEELVEQARAARVLAAESAKIEEEERLRAEQLASQLRACEQALRVSEREAQTSNRAKDEFLAMLGHELRNPLAPVLIALDLIAMDSSDPHKDKHAVIERQVRHLIQLVDDLLDVSRIRTGRVELQRQVLELVDIVSRAVETALPTIDAKRLVLRVDIPHAGLEVEGDMLRLAQAVGNLLTNAARYTPSGGSIEVTGERRDTTIYLRVRDTGIGISDDMLPRVFDVFTRDRASDSSGGGLGLGLAIARSLVTMHGGAVTARSEGHGRGSELVIELPAVHRQSDAAKTRSTRDVIDVVHACNILVVDDNREAARIEAEALTRIGHVVRVAFDGPSALSAIADFIPEVVLLDIGLPAMDGYEVARRLRAALSPHDVHFIAITGYGEPVDRQRSNGAGFDTHLVKPVDIATLKRNIDDSRTRTPRRPRE